MASSEWHWEQGVKYAVESIKTTLLLNGAAAIALMTFINTRQISCGVRLALVLFALGAMLSAFAFMCAYFTELSYGNAGVPGADKDHAWKKGQRWNSGTAVMALLSVAMFCVGAILTATNI